VHLVTNLTVSSLYYNKKGRPSAGGSHMSEAPTSLYYNDN